MPASGPPASPVNYSAAPHAPHLTRHQRACVQDSFFDWTFVEIPTKHYFDLFGGYMNFLNCCRLQFHNREDNEEDNNIIQRFRDQNIYEWDVKRKAKKTAKTNWTRQCIL